MRTYTWLVGNGKYSLSFTVFNVFNLSKLHLFLFFIHLGPACSLQFQWLFYRHGKRFLFCCERRPGSPGFEGAQLWMIAVCGCTYCHRTLHYLKMTAKLARQQSCIHLSNFTGALVHLPNTDEGYGASLPFWMPQGEIREFLSAALFK